MDQSNKPTTTGAEQEFSPGVVYVDCATEYTLPDYLSEIRRVLTLRCSIFPAGQFLGNGRAEFAGSCVFTVVYCDQEGKANAVNVPVDYEWAVNVGQADLRETKLYGDCKVENVSCRILGPRRVQVKGTIAGKARGWSPTHTSPFSAEEDLEMLQSTLPSRMAFPFEGDREKKTLSLKAEGAGPLRLLFYEGGMLIGGIEKQGDRFVAKGEIKVKGLCVGEDGTPFAIWGKIPFEDQLPPCPDGDVDVYCQGEILSLEGNITESGGEQNVLFELSTCQKGCYFLNQLYQPVTDAFSPFYPCHVKQEEQTVWEHLGVARGIFPCEGEVERKGEELEDAISVADTFVTAESPTLSMSDGKIEANTTAHVTMLLSTTPRDGASEPSMTSYSFDAPISATFPLIEGVTDDTDFETHMTFSPAEGRLDSGKLFYEFQMSMCVACAKKRTVRIATEMTLEEDQPFPSSEGEIIAAYLKDGDTLWGIAKRYHTPLDRIIDANDLPEDALDEPDQTYTLDGYSRLLITS
ncbi:MAG: LysM peptidoglycan-binding domain-containing protein [Clostridia bacterium]|nr:LysM peptidoglycan-binding domain-containing protein [Clostridia bacterium]